MDIARGATAAVAVDAARGLSARIDDGDAHGWPTVDLPDFGMPDARPELPAARYAARLAALRARADAARATTASSCTPTASTARTSSFLTGFDPRFEEAMLVVGPTAIRRHPRGQRVLGDGRRRAARRCAATGSRTSACPSQPRDRSRPLREILAGEGIGRRQPRRRRSAGSRTPDRSRIEVPAFLVDELRALTGAGGLVENANDLLIDPADGLRVINDVDQLAAFEHASCQTSTGVRRLLRGPRARA